jgi:hypothetical protein
MARNANWILVILRFEDHLNVNVIMIIMDHGLQPGCPRT